MSGVIGAYLDLTRSLMDAPEADVDRAWATQVCGESAKAFDRLPEPDRSMVGELIPSLWSDDPTATQRATEVLSALRPRDVPSTVRAFMEAILDLSNGMDDGGDEAIQVDWAIKARETSWGMLADVIDGDRALLLDVASSIREEDPQRSGLADMTIRGLRWWWYDEDPWPAASEE